MASKQWPLATKNQSRTQHIQSTPMCTQQSRKIYNWLCWESLPCLCNHRIRTSWARLKRSRGIYRLTLSKWCSALRACGYRKTWPLVSESFCTKEL